MLILMYFSPHVSFSSFCGKIREQNCYPTKELYQIILTLIEMYFNTLMDKISFQTSSKESTSTPT